MRHEWRAAELGTHLRRQLQAVGLVHSLSRGERALRHHHGRHVAVDVGHIRNIGGVVNNRLVDVRVVDHGHVVVIDIGHVHPVNIGRAGVIPRLIHFARSQGEPGSDGPDGDAEAASAADKSYQRG